MKSIVRSALLSVVSLFGPIVLYAQSTPDADPIPVPGPATPIASVGIGTATPKAFFNVAADKDVLYGLDVNGGGNKLIWYGSKGAFRAGFSGAAQWNISEVGQGSFASGISTRASGIGSTAMGNLSQATGLNTMALGFSSTAAGETATAIGNTAQAPGTSAMSIGTQTIASGPFSTALGFSAQASGPFSTALGSSVQAQGQNAVAIGNGVEASGDNSIALGTNVSTNDKNGSIIIGDQSPNRYVSDGNQKMTMRFGGGYVFYSAGGPQRLGDPFNVPPGVELKPGGNSWFLISDSTKKENYRHVDGAAFLKKISQMRLGSWNYRGQDPKIFRHYGPMAQDFFAAFGHDALGVIGEPTGINQGDFDGVNLIAIKALITEVDQLKAELAASRDREKTTQARLDKIEALLTASNGTLTLKP